MTSPLFQLYGLKIGQVENPEAIQRAIVQVQATGHQGLNCADDMPKAPVKSHAISHMISSAHP